MNTSVIDVLAKTENRMQNLFHRTMINIASQKPFNFAEDRLFANESVFITHTKMTGETSNFFYTNKEMGIPVHDDTFVSAFYVNTFLLKLCCIEIKICFS